MFRSITLACLAAAASADHEFAGSNADLRVPLNLIDDADGNLTLYTWTDSSGLTPKFKGDLVYVSKKPMDTEVWYGFCMAGFVENDAGTANDKAAYDCVVMETTIDAAKIQEQEYLTNRPDWSDFIVEDAYSYSTGETLRAYLEDEDTGFQWDTP